MERKNATREQVLLLLEQAGELSPALVRQVERQTGVPEAEIWGTARFYSLLSERSAALLLCRGLTCKLAGSRQLAAHLEQRGEPYRSVSCLGQCDRAPVALDQDLLVRHGRARGAVSPDDPDLPINLAGQDDASFAALHRARQLGPSAVLDTIEASGLQGRGGAGFPAHAKWRAVRAQASPLRHVVCNADEGEPGTFKDREIALRRPYRLIEGLAIAAWTVGAGTIHIFVRGEFPRVRAGLEQAIAAVGEALSGLDFRFVAGHGAYICGEETALIQAMEGRRGTPRIKPPFPTQVGLHGQPTLVHNVETLACLPSILLRGGEWFRAQGRTEPGSKLYCVTGHVHRPGVYELPLGVTLDDLVDQAGGYVGSPRAFCPGGASSGFLPMSMRDRPLDFQGLARIGSMLGSAGVVVMNDTVNMAQAALQQSIFFEDESCGQCAPCRIGTQVLRQALARFLAEGSPGALNGLDSVSWEMEQASLCGLGMVASRPYTSARRYFPGDFQPASSPEVS